MRKHVFWKKLILFFKYNNIIRRQNFPHFCFVLFEYGMVKCTIYRKSGEKNTNNKFQLAENILNNFIRLAIFRPKQSIS